MFNTLLVQPLFNFLALIYAIIPGRDFGFAVIVMTIVIRLLLWPIVNKQLHSQRAMQELAPEVTKLRAKAKGDKQLESKLLMELYKEKEISPFASLVPLFIQLPLLFALFIVLRDIVKPGEIAHLAYEPIKNLASIKAVISDNAAFKPTLLGFIDLAKPNLILAAAAALTQFFQARQLMPKPHDSSSRAMNNATTIAFPILTGIIALTLPSALPLYWSVTSAMAILQQHLVLNRDVIEMEEQAASPKASKGA